MPNTLYDKIWNDHLVDQQPDGTALLFVDRHLVHEVTSPQAFEGLRNSNRKVRHPKLTLAVADHNVPTTDRTNGIADQESKIQVDTLEKNCKEFEVQLFGMNDKRQGIVHNWTRARIYSTWNRNCLWRQSHSYTWCVWSFSIWNWYIGSRTRFSNTNISPKKSKKF